MKQKRICILGLGYIGLPTAAFLASKKTSVLGVDIDKGKIKELNSLNYTSNEKGLEIIVKDQDIDLMETKISKEMVKIILS